MSKGQHLRIFLTDEQRRDLNTLTKSGSSSARTQTRARILLLSDRSEGETRIQQEISDALSCSKSTVSNVRRRFVSEGLEAALTEKPRPGQRPKLDGEAEARLIVLACSDAPEGRAAWSLRLLADKMVELGICESLSHTTVGETLKKTRSNPGAYRRGASPSPRPNT